jgi:hypothetical protein
LEKQLQMELEKLRLELLFFLVEKEGELEERDRLDLLEKLGKVDYQLELMGQPSLCEVLPEDLVIPMNFFDCK